MFGKRVKCIRDMNAEVEILDKKMYREISKLNDNVRLEVKKRLKKIVPGIAVKIRKVTIDDFVYNKRRENPLEIAIESLNGKIVHKDGFWVEQDEETCLLFKTDNRIDVSEMEDICRELSEMLGVNLTLAKVSGKYR